MRLIDYFRQINLIDWGLGLGLLNTYGYNDNLLLVYKNK